MILMFVFALLSDATNHQNRHLWGVESLLVLLDSLHQALCLNELSCDRVRRSTVRGATTRSVENSQKGLVVQSRELRFDLGFTCVTFTKLLRR